MAGRKKATKTTELVGNDDGAAPLDSAAFLKAASPVLKLLKADLLARSEASPSVRAALTERHERERKAQRTGDSFVEWRGHFIDQVAAAWLLSCVFVRTLEDRKLLGHTRLAGPGAQDSQKLFFEVAPSLTERDYLLTTFRELSRFDSTRALFDGEHNPVWMLAPSAEAAKALLQLFRSPTAETPAFRFGQSDTRFLGDLYQDLDEGVQKRFALLQTPVFVEEYILDRTLEPAIQRFGLDETTLIDPTCGSGHFLLGAFARLFEHRRRAEPGGSEREAVYKALSAVAGADINPFAIAIARLRLTLAALEKAHFTRLADAPALPLNLAVADSLLYNPQISQQQFGMLEGAQLDAWLDDTYALEDPKAARAVLHKEYAAVVGNPPYITCKDAALRETYRNAYRSAVGKYALAVPFTERFLQLGRRGGSFGMITANSFMKREFGKALVEDVLPDWNLTRVENTSGAYIPGHGTPTVLLFGTVEPPTQTKVLAILAKRGEPTTPEIPSQGLVWRSLVDHGEEVGFEDDYITVANVNRDVLSKHPWSLGGGGASELKELLEQRAKARLSDIVDSIGIASFTLEDDVFLRPAGVWERARVSTSRLRPMVIGEAIRDWGIGDTPIAFFPYDRDFTPMTENDELRALWPWRTCLANNKLFGGVSKVQGGLKWYEYGRLTATKLRSPLTITFAFVATHNHFVLDRGGKVFKQSAPIIKLPETATEEDHLALLAYLNSSTACFWMKQAMMNKGGSGIGRGIQDEAWEARFEFDSTKMGRLPIPPNIEVLAKYAAEMSVLALDRFNVSPGRTVQQIFEGADTSVEASQATESTILNRMTALQERIDFEVYRLFGLVSSVPDQPPIPPGKRPFEVDLAKCSPETKWFERNGYEHPHPDLNVGPQTGDVLLLEQPTFKRRWVLFDWPAQISTAIKDAALKVAEDHLSKSKEAMPEPAITLPMLRAFRLKCFDEIDIHLSEWLFEASVPFLAALRFTAQGLERYGEWQKIWDLQRREDRGEAVGTLDVPPRYSKTDFRTPHYWSLRGKLDVPHERFISYPGCQSDEDGSPVYGWAGWNHLERAQALAALYTDRKEREGWKKERLLPMLAGILELLPWIKQWHNDPSDEYDGQRLGNFFEGYLEGQLREHGVTAADLEAIRPEERSPRSKRRAPAAEGTGL